MLTVKKTISGKVLAAAISASMLLAAMPANAEVLNYDDVMKESTGSVVYASMEQTVPGKKYAEVSQDYSVFYDGIASAKVKQQFGEYFAAGIWHPVTKQNNGIYEITAKVYVAQGSDIIGKKGAISMASYKGLTVNGWTKDVNANGTVDGASVFTAPKVTMHEGWNDITAYAEITEMEDSGFVVFSVYGSTDEYYVDNVVMKRIPCVKGITNTTFENGIGCYKVSGVSTEVSDFAPEGRTKSLKVTDTVQYGILRADHAQVRDGETYRIHAKVYVESAGDKDNVKFRFESGTGSPYGTGDTVIYSGEIPVGQWVELEKYWTYGHWGSAGYRDHMFKFNIGQDSNVKAVYYLSDLSFEPADLSGIDYINNGYWLTKGLSATKSTEKVLDGKTFSLYIKNEADSGRWIQHMVNLKYGKHYKGTAKVFVQDDEQLTGTQMYFGLTSKDREMINTGYASNYYIRDVKDVVKNGWMELSFDYTHADYQETAFMHLYMNGKGHYYIGDVTFEEVANEKKSANLTEVSISEDGTPSYTAAPDEDTVYMIRYQYVKDQAVLKAGYVEGGMPIPALETQDPEAVLKLTPILSDGTIEATVSANAPVVPEVLEIESVKIMDGSLLEAAEKISDSILESGIYNSIKYHNKTGATQTVKLYTALYEGDRLSQVFVRDAMIPDGDGIVEYPTEDEETISVGANITAVRTFIWDNNLKPYCNFAEITK